MWPIADELAEWMRLGARSIESAAFQMGISESDWQRFIGHLETTLDTFEVPVAERGEVLGFINSTKADIVE